MPAAGIVLSQATSATTASKRWPRQTSSIESAVALALEQGALTKDLGGAASCAEAGAAVLAAFARAEQQQQQGAR